MVVSQLRIVNMTAHDSALLRNFMKRKDNEDSFDWCRLTSSKLFENSQDTESLILI